MTVLVEVVMDRGMGSGKFLESFYIPEARHRLLSSSERLVGVLGSIVVPATALLRCDIADHLHRSTV